MRKLLILVMVCAITITSCTNSKNNNSTESSSSKSVSVKDNSSIASTVKLNTEINTPSSASELLQQKQGTFKGDTLNYYEDSPGLTKNIESIEAIPKNASNAELDELFSYLYSIVSFDFSDLNVDNILNKQYWKESSNINISKVSLKDKINIEIILDCSGSMAEEINGITKMDIAKSNIKTFFENMPPNVKVALRVFGHKGSNLEADKNESCSLGELIYKFNNYDKTKLDEALKDIEPTGWTSIANSLVEANEDLSSYNVNEYSSIIYLLTDGYENCNGDPIVAANIVLNSDIKPILNVVGINVDSETESLLSQIASTANGNYYSSKDNEELSSVLKNSVDILGVSNPSTNNLHRLSDITNWSNSFSIRKENQDTYLNRLIRYLYAEKVITEDQKNYLLAKKDSVNNNLKDYMDELLDKLYDKHLNISETEWATN